jgi:3-oxoacyl-[acyl-carrier protein] reductase
MTVTFDFSDRVAVITGAASGIGRLVAELLSEGGAKLLLGDVDATAVVEVADSLGGEASGVVGMAMDSADPESIAAFVMRARDIFGRIDIVVPAAGIYPETLVEATDNQLWRKVMSVNLDGVFYLLRDCIPLLSSDAAIVNVASIAAHRGSYNHAHYAASKAGIVSITKTLAAELGPRGVRVNAVSPGVISTPMTANLIATRGDASLRETPLGRFGEPSEVARVIAFLASDASSFVTGESIHINGGSFMGA